MVVIIGMQGEPVAAEAAMTLQLPEACRVFSREVVPGSWDTGSGRLHRLLVGGGGLDTDLCLHTGFLVAAAAALAFSCPSLGSKLIAVAPTHLWSSLRRCSAFCGNMGKESPLLVHPETMVSCLLGWSRLFTGLPLASCGTLAPFRLCSRSQPQSSPWDLTSKA